MYVYIYTYTYMFMYRSISLRHKCDQSGTGPILHELELHETVQGHPGK